MILDELKLIGEIINGSSFWSSLTSGFIVTALIGLFLPTYLSYIKRPKKFEFFFRDNGTNKLSLTKKDKNINYIIELSFRHLSGETFSKGIYWHLYIPKFINSTPVSIGPSTLPTQREEMSDEEVFIHFSGKISEPIFTGTTHWFYYKFEGNFDANIKQILDSKVITLYYFISTEYGNYPNNFKQNLKTGLIDVKTANKLYLSV